MLQLLFFKQMFELNVLQFKKLLLFFKLHLSFSFLLCLKLHILFKLHLSINLLVSLKVSLNLFVALNLQFLLSLKLLRLLLKLLLLFLKDLILLGLIQFTNAIHLLLAISFAHMVVNLLRFLMGLLALAFNEWWLKNLWCH